MHSLKDMRRHRDKRRDKLINKLYVWLKIAVATEVSPLIAEWISYDGCLLVLQNTLLDLRRQWGQPMQVQ